MNEPENTPDPTTSTALAAADTSPSSGRPPHLFAPGVSGNPGGRPKDPFASLIRKDTDNGAEIVAFLLACMRDELDGRLADRAGVIDRWEADADTIMAGVRELQRDAKDDPDQTIKIAKVVQERTNEAALLKVKARTLRARLARRRKVAVPVKQRQVAAALLLERGWGKALERVDLKVGGDGTPIGAAAAPGAGPLPALTEDDLAKIGAVLEGAAKRAEVVPAEASAVESSS